MVLLDQIVRSAAIAILATMAVVLLRDRRRIPFAGAAVGFFVTVAAHLVLTSPDYAGVRGLDTLLMAAALAVPASFLLFSRAFFEEERGATWWDLGILVALVATGCLRATALPAVGTVLYYAGSLAVVALALARVVRGLPSDLVEPYRRRLRAQPATV